MVIFPAIETSLMHLLLQAVFETRLRELGIALPLMCCAADMLSVPSRKQVVLVGDKGSAEFQDMVVAAFSSYDPNRTVSDELTGHILCSCYIFADWDTSFIYPGDPDRP
jgi:hypothetical protein